MQPWGKDTGNYPSGFWRLGRARTTVSTPKYEPRLQLPLTKERHSDAFKWLLPAGAHVNPFTSTLEDRTPLYAAVEAVV